MKVQLFNYFFMAITLLNVSSSSVNENESAIAERDIQSVSHNDRRFLPLAAIGARLAVGAAKGIARGVVSRIASRRKK